MKFQASTILGFITGRHYASLPPTEAYGHICEVVSGVGKVTTDMLPSMKKQYIDAVLAQLPPELQKTVTEWRHTPDWEERVDMIDEAFGMIEITKAQ